MLSRGIQTHTHRLDPVLAQSLVLAGRYKKQMQSTDVVRAQLQPIIDECANKPELGILRTENAFNRKVEKLPRKRDIPNTVQYPRMPTAMDPPQPGVSVASTNMHANILAQLRALAKLRGKPKAVMKSQMRVAIQLHSMMQVVADSWMYVLICDAVDNSGSSTADQGFHIYEEIVTGTANPYKIRLVGKRIQCRFEAEYIHPLPPVSRTHGHEQEFLLRYP